MPERYAAEETGPVALALQALLYAGGELAAPEAAAFEARLGQDQEAQELLCQAVQIAHARAGLATPQPDPAYRRRVQDWLRPGRGWWGWLTARRSYPGHPAAWGGFGAAASLLLMIGLAGGWPASCPCSPPPAPGETGKSKWAPPGRSRLPGGKDPDREAGRNLPPEQLSSAASTEEARAWAELKASMTWRQRFLHDAGRKH
jgi:hypothetical protein